MDSGKENKLPIGFLLKTAGMIAFILYFAVYGYGGSDDENNQTQWDKDNMRQIASDDSLLLMAEEMAQKNLPYFKIEFESKEQSGKEFFAKVPLTVDDNVEHIWVEILKLNGDKSVGVLYNEPSYFKRLKFLDTLNFDIDRAEDLEISRNDTIFHGQFLRSLSEEVE